MLHCVFTCFDNVLFQQNPLWTNTFIVNADRSINIYIFFFHVSFFLISGGAELEFQSIVFSESDYLVSVSAIPNFEMVLWYVWSISHFIVSLC